MNDIQSKVAELIKRAAPAIKTPIGETHLEEFLNIRIDDLDLDSLDSMELILDIEDSFGIMLDEEAVVACQGIGDLIELVTSYVGARK